MALENKVAEIFGKEASLLMPSDRMSYLIGMMVNVKSKGERAIIGN